MKEHEFFGTVMADADVAGRQFAQALMEIPPKKALEFCKSAQRKALKERGAESSLAYLLGTLVNHFYANTNKAA